MDRAAFPFRATPQVNPFAVTSGSAAFSDCCVALHVVGQGTYRDVEQIRQLSRILPTECYL